MSGQQKRPFVRLNLNKPRHQQAWEYLQSRKDQSHTEIIVDALIHMADREFPTETLNAICKAVKNTIREALQAGANMPVTTPPESEEPAPMTKEDFDAVMDFMDGL